MQIQARRILLLVAVLVTISYITCTTVFLEDDPSAPSESALHILKKQLWEELKLKQDEQHQYCMLWCPAEQFENISEWDFYRDLTPEQAQSLGSYYATENRDIYQAFSVRNVNSVCCQIATKESFTVIYDTRHSEDLGEDVSIVTFGTFDRLSAVVETKRRWKGPLVVVLYVSDHNDPFYGTLNDGEHLSSKQVYEGLAKFPVLDNVLILTYNGSFEKDQNVLRVGYNAKYFNPQEHRFDSDPSLTLHSREAALERKLSLIVDFPINTLRNVAQDFAETRYVLALDLDFIPDVGAYEYLRAARKSYMASESKVAIILPHFETNRKVCLNKSGEYNYPEDYAAFIQQFRAGLVRPCRISLRKWVELGYGSWSEQDLQNSTCSLHYLLTERQSFSYLNGTYLVNYPKWFELSSTSNESMYEISQKELVEERSLSFEPYFMLDKVANSSHPLARYNEVFMNRQKDKSSWIVHLKMSGYRFFVGVHHFIIHQDHKSSSWTVAPDRNSTTIFWHDIRFTKTVHIYKDTLQKIYG
jgi:hypothetical protein